VGEEPDKIKAHIDNERRYLGRNIVEIEDRLKDATDLQANFNRNTGWFLGAAVAGGFLLSVALSKPKHETGKHWPREVPRDAELTEPSPGFISSHLSPVSETLDNIFSGLIGVFSEKLHSVVADAVPGFEEQYDRIRHRDQPVRSGSRI
jgi:hypothetical protein